MKIDFSRAASEQASKRASTIAETDVRTTPHRACGPRTAARIDVFLQRRRRNGDARFRETRNLGFESQPTEYKTVELTV